MARVYQLAKTTGTGAQAAVDLSAQVDRDETVLQVEFSTTGAVSIEGRIDGDMSWIVIAGPYSSDTLVPIAFVPSMRANIASNGGTITVKLAAS